jgi:formate dehydrogenase iron-sulfur subunit
MISRRDRNTVTGFLTDATLCIGCKACEVACKEWNQIPANGSGWTGLSYDNTLELGASTWRHVKFVETATPAEGFGGNAAEGPFWAFSSDVCKHCEVAGCLEACPTGAIVRTEFGGVYIQPDICNGCGYCVPACPFGVVETRAGDGRAFKCTFCYDRQKVGLEPACAKACPTKSIQFGSLEDLREKAASRLRELRARGIEDATLWDPVETTVGGVHALFVVRGDARAHNLPPAPEVPTAYVRRGWVAAAVAAGFLLTASLVAFAAESGR